MTESNLMPKIFSSLSINDESVRRTRALYGPGFYYFFYSIKDGFSPVFIVYRENSFFLDFFFSNMHTLSWL